jgi:hypothetical protein
MPDDHFFSPNAPVSDYRYLLGLDTDPSEDPRSPREVEGDPGLCAWLEARSRFENSSTNFVISWTEWLEDSVQRTFVRKYVEEGLLIGVPRNFYVYTLTAHDEPVRGADGTVKRSSCHAKILGLRLPSGGYLQPFYPKRDRLLTTLFLADAAIKNNWTSPLDPGRERLEFDGHKYSKIRPTKLIIDNAVKAAPRLPGGAPDPVAIVTALRGLYNGDIFPTTGVLGKRGIALHFDDHPKPVRFFGEEYAALHQLITMNSGPKNDDNGTTKNRRSEEFFPHGILKRDDKSAENIARGLNEYLAARATFNFRRYHLDRPTLVLGGFTVGVDTNEPPNLGVLHRPTDSRQPGLEGSTGPLSKPQIPGAAETVAREQRQPDPADQLIPHAQSTNKPYPQNEHTTERHSAREESDTDLRGKLPHVGVLVAAIAAVVSRILGQIFSAAERVGSTIDAIIESRSRRSRELNEASHDLEEANQRLGSQGRYLDEVIAEFSENARQLETGEIDEDDVDPYLNEWVSRGIPLISVAPQIRKPPTPPTEEQPEPEIEM